VSQQTDEFSEPPGSLADPSTLLIGYLRAYRDTLLRKLDGLDDEQLRSAILPSGWTPLQLLKHLAHVERRWFGWGFLGRQLTDPWADHDPDDPDHWYVAPDETVAGLRSFLADQAAVADRVLAEHRLDEAAATGGRFADDPPTLGWIGFHVLQEYARHLGHLDVVRELIDNSVGK
jgi:uncharacterized damage-inducible protein DinB